MVGKRGVCVVLIGLVMSVVGKEEVGVWHVAVSVRTLLQKVKEKPLGGKVKKKKKGGVCGVWR